MKKKIKPFLFGLVLISLMMMGCKGEKKPVTTPSDVTDMSGNSSEPAEPSGPDNRTESDSRAKLDENGNQTDSETIDLDKAVSREYVEQNVSYSAMMRITINPYLLLYLDQDGIVLAYHYENKDAADAYKDVSFTGNNVKDAIKKVTNTALKTDYLKPEADMIIEVAEVKDTAFQVNETLYIAEVTANKTLREHHRKAEVAVAMPPEVEKIAEEQGEFVLENLSEPQDLTYLTDMLDYSATMKIGDDNPVVLFLDDAGTVMAYGFENQDTEAPQELSSPVGQSVSDAAKAITQNLIETNNVTDETVLKVEVSEALDDYFRTDDFFNDTQNTVQNVLDENDVAATVEVELTAEPPKEEEAFPAPGENPADEKLPDDECETCHGTHTVHCPYCADLGYISCDTCGSTGTTLCPDCSGSKTIACDLCNGSGYDPAPCPYCRGTGNCPTCGGSGVETMEDGNEGPCHHCDGNGHCSNWYVDHNDVCYGHGPCPRCEMKRYNNCHRCQGTGTEQCNECGGDGGRTCPDCNGTKLLPCPDCTGNS